MRLELAKLTQFLSLLLSLSLLDSASPPFPRFALMLPHFLFLDRIVLLRRPPRRRSPALLSRVSLPRTSFQEAYLHAGSRLLLPRVNLVNHRGYKRDGFD